MARPVVTPSPFGDGRYRMVPLRARRIGEALAWVTSSAAGMAVAAVLIGLSDNVVRPWVRSAGGRLHPLLALLSIFGGIEAFGAAGVFLGPVVAALAGWALDTHAAAHPGAAAE